MCPIALAFEIFDTTPLCGGVHLPGARWRVCGHAVRTLLGPVDPSFRALSGRLTFTVRRHKFNEDSLCTLTDTTALVPSLSLSA